ncbi:DegT/DnrJ/EryC1/StrS family aminotransferase [Actinophytocola sp.]|uniref:DegT/DnrJ/EryC1/StrS family aminotransferase n=1 Tax=Actinophytocola sp. TaxID=1872138 RepID=UPI002ED1E9AB
MRDYKVPKYNYAAQFRALRDGLVPEIERLLLDGRYVLGPPTEEFERAFAHFLGGVGVAGLNSGTDALVLALDAVGVRAGDEVVTVANTFHATALAAARLGATPVFVDCRESDFLVDLDQVPAALGPRTRAVVVVHLFGQAVDVERAIGICAAGGVTLVEDCAQAVGARSGGHRVGTRSSAGCWSFSPAKNLAAAGDAGAISTPDPEVARRVALLRHFGQPRQNEHEILGYNSRLDAIQALVLSHKLDMVDDWSRARGEVAARYRAELSGLPLRFQEGAAPEEHVYHLFQVRTESERVRDALVDHLQDHGIDAVVRYPVPLHLQPAFADLGLRRGRFPVAEKLAVETLCLPIRPDLDEGDISYVCETVRGFYGTP